MANMNDRIKPYPAEQQWIIPRFIRWLFGAVRWCCKIKYVVQDWIIKRKLEGKGL